MKRKILFTALFMIIFIFVSSFLFLGVSAASPEARILIDLNTEWRYLDNNTDPASGLDSITAWTLPEFDDSGWKRGIGSFGSKSGEIANINGQTPNVLLNLFIEDTQTCVPTYFFRTTFTVTDLEQYNTLYFKAYADDAIAVYLNGTLVLDSRSTKKTNTNLYYASGNWDQAFFVELDEFDLLREGENTVAVQLHNNQNASSDIYLGIHEMSLSYQDPTLIVAEKVVLGVGEDETRRNLSWFSNSQDAAEVRLAPAALVKNGVFPSEYTAFSSASQSSNNVIARYAKKATITGLESDTDYAYVIAVGDKTSSIYYFSTDKEGDFDFLFVGDPQVSTQNHGLAWQDTLNKLSDNFDAELLISAGDQVSVADSEENYTNFLVDEMSGFAFAPSVGPSHDSQSVSFSNHYNPPNLSADYGVSTTSSNYWYTYNGVLFMHLNMSDSSAATNGEHESFIKEAMAKNPKAKWNIVIMHISLFSAGMHGDPEYKSYASEIGKLRPAMAPILSSLGVDLVLSGHDHSYVRTKTMNGTTPTDDVIKNNVISSPTGPLYICAGSSTGSAFYEKKTDGDFIAFENYEKRKSAVRVQVSDEKLVINAYFLDDMSAFDTFTLEKEPHTCAPKAVDEIPAMCTQNGKRSYYLCDCGTAYKDEEGTEMIVDLASYGVIYKKGHLFAEATCTEAECCTAPGCTVKRGEPLSHLYDDDSDSVCNRCAMERDIPSQGLTPIVTTVIVVASIACVSAGGIGAFFIVRKRKSKL